MTSTALRVLSLALVLSTVGISSETADHASKRDKRVMNEENHFMNRKMQLRTNLYDNIDHRNIEDTVHNDLNITFDEIYIEDEETKINDMEKETIITERQYSFSDNNYEKVLKRVKRDDDKCELFVHNRKENRIQHPHDKNSKEKLYYSNAECVTVIQADLMTQVIKLTFIDKFHIEDHPDCAYDYLEIRDGAQGYAKLLTGKKLCGSAFPPQIISTGSYMWLKFFSDDTIEYEGFNIKVEFETTNTAYNPPQACNISYTKTVNGEIDSNKIEECLKQTENQVLDVVWTIEAPENMKIYLNFSSYELAKPNECEENVVEVYGYILEEESRLARYCGSIANSVMTKGDGKNGEKGNIMYVRLFASKAAKAKSHFSANYTAFRPLDPSKDEKCKEGEEFDCEDNTCIADNLMCDGYAHCRLKADEDETLCKTETESVIGEIHIQVILVIFCLILSGMSFVFLFKCIRKLYMDHKIIKDQIANSCEDRLDKLVDSRFTLDVKKLQRESEPRASLERDNHTNEMVKQQRKLSQQKQSSLDSDFIQETHVGLDEEPWRRDVNSIPIEAQDIKIERNGRTRRDTRRDTEREIHIENRKEHDRERRVIEREDSRRSEEKKEIRDASVGVPDTKESGCQTRESLFQAETALSSDGSNSNSRGFSTFGYSGATIARPSPPVAPTSTSEITIELLRKIPSRPESKAQKKISDRRPMSTETTRSAPDVIIVSKPIR